MLTELRKKEIIKLVNKKGSVSAHELMDLYDASESTIRRDLNELHKTGAIIKVHGGAISLSNVTSNYSVSERELRNKDEKIKIARYCADLICNNDYVYIDASTTTAYMIDFIKVSSASFVTNSVSIAQKLAKKGFSVAIPGGTLKLSSEAVIGEEALIFLDKYHFKLGFFGTNAVSVTTGFSTPESHEASIKHKAMKQCQKCYVVADADKFDQTSSVTFGEFTDATVVSTNQVPEKYRHFENVIIV